jgi:GR25 family glycosyltransferase involved in LPS biosynthesis
MPIPYKGYYINLASSAGRNLAMREQFRSLGVADRYERFDAVVGGKSPRRGETTMSSGHLGCWLSHQAVWKRNIGSSQHIHVLEDDAALSPQLLKALASIDLPDDGWDLLFTDVFFHPPPTPEQFVHVSRYIGAYRERGHLTLMDLKNWSFTDTTSYLVNHRSIAKIHALIDGQWRQNRTLDVYLHGLVRSARIRALVTIPFLTTLDHTNAESTTGAQGVSFAEIAAFRASLHYRADPAAIYAGMRNRHFTQETEPLLALYLEMLHSVLSNIS